MKTNIPSDDAADHDQHEGACFIIAIMFAAMFVSPRGEEDQKGREARPKKRELGMVETGTRRWRTVTED